MLPLSEEYRAFVKLCASGTGHKGFGQECDLTDVYKSFKAILRAMEKVYQRENKDVRKLDPNMKIPENIAQQLPKEERFWDDFQQSELVQWLNDQISGRGGPPKAGFCLSKFWVLARYLYVYEVVR